MKKGSEYTLFAHQVHVHVSRYTRAIVVTKFIEGQRRDSADGGKIQDKEWQASNRAHHAC